MRLGNLDAASFLAGFGFGIGDTSKLDGLTDEVFKACKKMVSATPPRRFRVAYSARAPPTRTTTLYDDPRDRGAPRARRWRASRGSEAGPIPTASQQAAVVRRAPRRTRGPPAEARSSNVVSLRFAAATRSPSVPAG